MVLNFAGAWWDMCASSVTSFLGNENCHINNAACQFCSFKTIFATCIIITSSSSNNKNISRIIGSFIYFFVYLFIHFCNQKFLFLFVVLPDPWSQTWRKFIAQPLHLFLYSIFIALPFVIFCCIRFILNITSKKSKYGSWVFRGR